MTTRVIIWLSFELKTSLVAKILVEINILILKRPQVVFTTAEKPSPKKYKKPLGLSNVASDVAKVTKNITWKVL